MTNPLKGKNKPLLFLLEDEQRLFIYINPLKYS